MLVLVFICIIVYVSCQPGIPIDPPGIIDSPDCSLFTDCLSCAAVIDCGWCQNTNSNLQKLNYCFSMTANITQEAACLETSAFELFRYDDTCKVVNRPTTPDAFLSQWMSNVMPAISALTLLDLALPGTHDTLTYNLSTIVSDGGIDGEEFFASLLHDYSTIVPTGIEDYIRLQAQTQDLTITQQLDNGIRFIDARMMFEYDDVDPYWLSLHCVESNDRMIRYLTDIRTWMDKNPTEIVVMWLSKHGSTCAVGDDAYPNVTISEKQNWWNNIVNLYDGILTDFSISPINTTSIGTMLSRNHRLVLYVSDYVEMTSSSKFALDACLIDNRLGPGMNNELESAKWSNNLFATAQSVKVTDKKNQGFLLASMAAGSKFDLYIVSIY